MSSFENSLQRFWAIEEVPVTKLLTDEEKRCEENVALFVYFSTKAIHMETVTTLTKEDCLDAIKRFIARRGLPENIYSENSRTFIGTRGEIEFRKLSMDREFKELVDVFTTGQQINWLTIPPLTPHFVGLWEAAIKFM